jgi:uncharacterized protein (DUF488 family)
MNSIFSIGHGHKSIETFIDELKSFDIAYLVDIRTRPFSKWSPAFNRTALQACLEQQAITYVYMGHELGGLPRDASCYQDGKVDYSILKTKPFFLKGMERLIVANQKALNLAIMCCESDPAKCHRTKLIGVELMRHNIQLRHIVGAGKEKSQTDLLAESTKGRGLKNLFNTTTLTSNKRYT